MLAAIVAVGVCAHAQLLVQTDGSDAPQRIARARALAAVGNLPAARSELESLRRAQTDESVREIALVLLVGIYLEQSDYSYAQTLLDESFAARQPTATGSAHSYFALAGQVINGVRAHLERYRNLGLDIGDTALPAEATSDLDKLRALLEHVVAQGKQLRAENERGVEAAALLEEASVVRARLARTNAERAQWQREVTDARQQLMGPGTRVVAVAARPQPTPTAIAPANNSPVDVSSNSTANAPAQTAPAQAAPAVSPAHGSTSGGANPADVVAGGASETPNQPVDVGALLITKARARFAPSYPAQARSARVTGSVTVYLTVNERGEVVEVQRTSGPEMLRRAAEDAARRWKFRPTLINGQAVRVAGYISFNFAL